jgi:ATP-dependent protease ClpP protease subunit
MRDLIAALHARLGTRPANALDRVTGRPASSHRITNASADEATVWVYDVIGDWGVSAAELVPAIESISAPSITVRVNSPGGDYFAGVAIANALARHPARVTVHVDALAASAASVIAMAGDDIVMHPGAQMMIHDALTVTMGNAAEHEHTAALLHAASADIAGVYAARSGLHDAAHFRTLMQAETWLTADAAVELGLATKVAERELPEPAATTNDTPRWITLLHDFRTVDETYAATSAGGVPPADVVHCGRGCECLPSEPCPARTQTTDAAPAAEVASPAEAITAPVRSPIAALFGPAHTERKAP